MGDFSEQITLALLQDMKLRYGTERELSLDLSESEILAVCGMPQAEPLDDTVAAVAASLVDPLDFPPLAEASVPGDRFAVAIHRSVPQKRLVLAGILQSLAIPPLDPGAIDVLLAPGSGDDPRLQDAIPDPLKERVTIGVHDPDEVEELAYLATTQDGKAVHINRKLTDADVVITVGCIRPTGTTGYANAHGGVFPAFADSEMRNRFLAPATGLESRENHLRSREADEVAWLLGARLTIQMIPGAGDDMLKVVAGDVDSVIEHGRGLSGQVWESTLPQEAACVVAAIQGGATQQTWENVGRAVEAAARIVKDNGAIVVCSELDEPPGRAMGQLIGVRDEEETAREIAKQPSSDAEAATQVLAALGRAHVYLLSKLDPGLVEDMGFVPVTDPDEVSNVCKRHLPCALLANAQHARPSVSTDSVSASPGDENAIL
jgi:hypothetical protein